MKAGAMALDLHPGASHRGRRGGVPEIPSALLPGLLPAPGKDGILSEGKPGPRPEDRRVGSLVAPFSEWPGKQGALCSGGLCRRVFAASGKC